jgi:hypothetical protein
MTEQDTNCFSGDTRVYTVEYGCITMQQIVGQRVTVLNSNNQKSRVVFKTYGIQNIWSLVLSRGDSLEETLKVTPNHQWILVDGTKVKTMNLRRQELKSIYGDRWTVKEVIPTEQQSEVFCCEEPDTHSFVLFGGLLTGNCTPN